MVQHVSVGVLAVALSIAQVHGAFAAPRPSRAEVEALLTSPTRRVRSVEPRIQILLHKGVQWSSTFRDLVVALNRTSVIVYIQTAPNLPPSVDGRLMLASAPGQPRYLRIQIRPDGQTNELIALIGHELQHAIEVADAQEVTNDETLATLYRRIGHAEGRGFDTVAAVDTGRRVRLELGV